ncbi:conserved hypothetical protein [Planctopirus limnophila DSM 3776]|uniref:Transposase IS200-like domain-containing protein n=2 Tax=Planctopirus limnophila TaxID=120 RepID=D5SPH3_PLAL2|nr:conserved hypothetical protein [Planctopirus limnophila DSM 3776]
MIRITMSDYRRNYNGRTFFFTVVTERRRPILTTDTARHHLRQAIRTVHRKHPFEIVAIVLLPDHLHTVWTLPRNDVDYSRRWRLIKMYFTKAWLQEGNADVTPSTSRQSRGEQAIWQRRFYEHTCRDEEDLKRCIDYIHANPLKHGLVNRVADWPWSSFHRFVQAGEYTLEWGRTISWDNDEFSDFE